MATYVYAGDRIPYTPTAAVAAGDVVVQGDLVGVATAPIAAGTTGTITVRGAFTFPKGSGAISAGAKVYWDATNKIVVTSDGGGANKLVGKVVTAAAANDTTVQVLLTP